MLEEEYRDGMLNGETIVYDSLGNEFIKQHFKDSKKDGNSVFTYYGSNKKWIQMRFNDGLPDGKLTSYYPDGKVKRKESYTNGELSDSKCYAENGDEVEYYPLFLKEEFQEDVMTYIGRELRYPAEAKKQKLEGKVVVRFDISETGMVSDVEVVRSAGADFDQEAVRLISHMPPWTPLYVDGIPMKTSKQLPIVFWLQD